MRRFVDIVKDITYCDTYTLRIIAGHLPGGGTSEDIINVGVLKPFKGVAEQGVTQGRTCTRTPIIGVGL